MSTVKISVDRVARANILITILSQENSKTIVPVSQLIGIHGITSVYLRWPLQRENMNEPIEVQDYVQNQEGAKGSALWLSCTCQL